MRINRAAVVKSLLELYPSPNYLEIGVHKGLTFNSASAELKVAVDPHFKFNVKEAAAANPGAVYHEVTSDKYFSELIHRDASFDVIFLDGLHTAEQTLRDFLNAIMFISPTGVILIDDTRPTSHLASIGDPKTYAKVKAYIPNPDTSWMGDVFKTVYFIETFCQQFNFATINENHGQTVVWQESRKSVPERAIEEIGNKTFNELILSIETLKSKPFGDILEEIRRNIVERG